MQDLEPILEAEKALEQDYFDRAKDALDAAIAQREGPSSGGTPFERRAFAAAEARRQRLGADEPVAFGRIDLEDAETRYIGKVAIRNADADTLVYQWQSPAADGFNLATESDPKGVARKRVFDAPDNRIESFEDTLFQQLSVDYQQLAEFSSAVDPLLEDLGRQRETQMRDIVRTIQAEQNRLVRAEKDQLLVIQGGPGTGKTAVALHRVSWLLYNYQNELAPQDVLVVGPNPTFTKYIQRVLPDLGDEDVVQQSLNQLLGGSTSVRDVEDAKAARLKGSASMAGIVVKALNKRVRIPIAGLRLKRKDSAATALVTETDIKAALKTIRSGTYNERRIILRRAILAAAQSRLPMLGNLSAEAIFDSSSVESELDKVWPSMSPVQFVRELYGSKERLKLAGASSSQVSALYRRPKPRVADELWTAADLAVIDQATHAIQGAESRYGHIVIDEAQDLSVMQLKAIRRRSRTGSMTVVGDIAQSTTAYARQDWDQVLKELSSELPSNSETLEVGYRVPKQVFQIAEKVLEYAAPNITAPRILRSVQESPRWLIAKSEALSAQVVEAVRDHSSRGLFVGVVASEHLWPALRREFESAGLRWGESANGGLSQGINLVTPEDSKGVEFDAVVVVDPQRILNETKGDRLLYVALTRTIHFLDVVMPEGRVPALFEEFLTAKDAEQPAEVGEEEPVAISSSAAEGGSELPSDNEEPASMPSGAEGPGSDMELQTKDSGEQQEDLEHAQEEEADQVADDGIDGHDSEKSTEETGLEAKSGEISQSGSAEARSTKAVGETPGARSGVLPNPHAEAIAQQLAERLFSELEEETGRSGQRRVVELLALKLRL